MKGEIKELTQKLEFERRENSERLINSNRIMAENS
jgi:hypothetical protein